MRSPAVFGLVGTAYSIGVVPFVDPDQPGYRVEVSLENTGAVWIELPQNLLTGTSQLEPRGNKVAQDDPQDEYLGKVVMETSPASMQCFDRGGSVYGSYFFLLRGDAKSNPDTYQQSGMGWLRSGSDTKLAAIVTRDGQLVTDPARKRVVRKFCNLIAARHAAIHEYLKSIQKNNDVRFHHPDRPIALILDVNNEEYFPDDAVDVGQAEKALLQNRVGLFRNEQEVKAILAEMQEADADSEYKYDNRGSHSVIECHGEGMTPFAKYLFDNSEVKHPYLNPLSAPFKAYMLEKFPNSPFEQDDVLKLFCDMLYLRVIEARKLLKDTTTPLSPIQQHRPFSG